MFCYYGFEACGDVAEETPDASRMIPKAMRMTIYIGGAAAHWVCLAFVLSIPDIGAVMSGKDTDPIVTLLKAAMGEGGFRAVIVVVLVSFISCLLSLQAAASRLIFAYARDQMIFGSRYLSRMSPGHHVPANALIVMGAIPAVIALSALWLQDAIATIISFAAVGIYISFQMVVLAALIARAKGWRPSGPFTLAGWGWLVNVLALAYGVGAIVNILWPRSPNDPWYVDYGMLVTTAGRDGSRRLLHGHGQALRARQCTRGRRAQIGARERGGARGSSADRMIRGKAHARSGMIGAASSRARLKDKGPPSRHCRHRRSSWCR